MLLRSELPPFAQQSIGGKAKAQEVNRALMPFVDVIIGNEEDFTAALGYSVREWMKTFPAHHANFRR
jgi:hypothetical protein